LRSFNVAASKVLGSRADEELKQSTIAELKRLFAAKIANAYNQTDHEILKDMHTQIMMLLHLLQVWHSYLDIIYMPA